MAQWLRVLSKHEDQTGSGPSSHITSLETHWVFQVNIVTLALRWAETRGLLGLAGSQPSQENEALLHGNLDLEE